MENFLDNKNMLYVLKMIFFGILFRLGLNNVLRVKIGGLIVIVINEDVMKIVDGGFVINVEYLLLYLYELVKMDGVIVLSGDVKKILFVNV